MKSFELPNLREGYVDLVGYVKKYGKEVAPRGYKTWEIEDAVFEIANPLDVMPYGVGRNLKPDIGAAEAVLIASGLSDPTFLISVSKQFARFLDGGILHGGYGWRLRPQLLNAVERLQRDPDTRQAIMTIWDPLHDQQDARDTPCTLDLGFRIRDGKLNASVTMRSNDVWLGTAYDVFMFTQLQATIANALQLPVGTYTHHAYSLHLYERNLEAAEQLHEPEFDIRNETLHPRGFGYRFEGDGFTLPVQAAPVERMAHFMERASCIYDKTPIAGGPTVSEEWYVDLLDKYDRASRMENFSS